VLAYHIIGIIVNPKVRWRLQHYISVGRYRIRLLQIQPAISDTEDVTVRAVEHYNHLLSEKKRGMTYHNLCPLCCVYLVHIRVDVVALQIPNRTIIGSRMFLPPDSQIPYKGPVGRYSQKNLCSNV
jgi:hypothetical protein